MGITAWLLREPWESCWLQHGLKNHGGYAGGDVGWAVCECGARAALLAMCSMRSAGLG